jgi:hypothetical protein
MNHFHLARKCRVVLGVTALALALSACSGSDNGSANPTTRLAASVSAVTVSAAVSSLTKISETRASRTEFDYVYKVMLTNGAAAQDYATATITAAGPGVTIIDGVASFGQVPAGATVGSTDTITLRIDRTRTFDPAALVWKIQSESGAHALARLESEGQIPRLDRSSALSGPDTNGNGIRDDLDTYLGSLALPQQQRAAAEQLARGFQAAVTIDSADPARTSAIDNRIRDAISCIWARFPHVAGSAPNASKMVHDLEKLTANTEARTRSYLKYNSSLNGTVASLPQGDGCEQ